jgi:hypothetical protein
MAHQMAKRFDISDKVIHFTNGESKDDAFARLRAIIGERRLIGSSIMVRGGYRCVSFTEAPTGAFVDDFVRQFPFKRYSQFGLMFPKSWVYDRGGRPVIYGPWSDFGILPEELRWRHVRYEPTGEQVIDFTWEREWRMRCDELPFSPAEAAIIVPNEEWASALRRTHDAQQDMVVELYAAAIERQIAELWREPFRWHIAPLQ